MENLALTGEGVAERAGSLLLLLVVAVMVVGVVEGILLLLLVGVTLDGVMGWWLLELSLKGSGCNDLEDPAKKLQTDQGLVKQEMFIAV